MKLKNNSCSRADAERYLLNRMTNDEETSFQQHLETCEACRSCLRQVRSLSQAFLADNDRQTAVFRLRPFKRPPVRYLFRAAAAGILLAGGLSVFLSRRNAGNGDAYDLQIEHQHRATVAYADTSFQLLSPPYPVCTLDVRTTPLLFWWNRETAYLLRITSGGRTAVAVDSVGDRYMPEPVAVVAYDSLEWMLEADGQVITGKIVNRRDRKN
jgi:hypothetical protein